MNWNNLDGEYRIFHWKKFRNDIKEFSLEQQLEQIAKFYSTIPYGARTLDYYSPYDWPTPWEILFYGSFCTSSISLLIFYTFVLTPIDVKIELHLVEDDDGIYLLPVIGDQFVMNYELGKVSKHPNIKDKIKVLKIYQKEQIKAII
jgi:hypothetical protein